VILGDGLARIISHRCEPGAGGTDAIPFQSLHACHVDKYGRRLHVGHDITAWDYTK
jgi:hypothetical protein